MVPSRRLKRGWSLIARKGTDGRFPLAIQRRRRPHGAAGPRQRSADAEGVGGPNSSTAVCRCPRLAIEDHSFDRASTAEHPIGVLKLVQRLAALMLTFALVAGNAAAMCAGWKPTAEARMACCADGVECPMHKGNSHRSGAERVLTQAQADSCCASSEGKNSNQSSPTFVAAITAAVLGDGIILPANVPALVLSGEWRTSAPISVEPVPKHVLFSVFLV
jgi:hypothetical protein